MRISKRKTLKVDDLNHSLRFFNFKVMIVVNSNYMGMIHMLMLSMKELILSMGYGGLSKMYVYLI